MAIVPGTRLGAFEVLAEIGAGGMGQVFRARDTKLGREVALKVVHARLGSTPEHVARFQREAQMLAALNHPSIAGIYELDEADGVLFLVMEYVPGETLRERLAAGPLGLSETLRVCSQIAVALEAAHDKGIIHRDLKPANIKIAPDGGVKVLDFGLAKALASVDSGGGLSQFATMEGSGHGAIIGTHAYMSPEQARGKPVDRRADIWAFGCVMFEALTGRQPFAGETASDTMARTLERDPDWQCLPPDAPVCIQRLLHRCLQKDPQQRLRDIGDVRLYLEDAAHDPGTSRSGHADPARSRRALLSAMGLAAAGIVVGAAIAITMTRGARAPSRPAAHFVVPLPSAERLANVDFPAIAISPDGTYVAYVASRGGGPQLFLRAMNALQATAIPGTAEASSPFFSPDSRWVAFFADGKLKKAPVAGGAPVTLCDAPTGFGGSWGAGDRIVFSPTTGSGLSQVSGDGGKPTHLTTLDAQAGEFSHRWPELLPGGNTVLFTVGTVGSWDDAQIVAQSIGSGRRQVIVHGGTDPHYLPTGHLLYARAGALVAVRFEAATLKVTGPPIQVLDRVLESFDGAAQVAASQTGTVVYVPGTFESTARLLIGVDRSGAPTPFAAPPRAYAAPRLSPDGRRIAVTIAGTTEDVWVFDLAQGQLTQVTFDTNSSSPLWTPDGTRVTFSSNKNGVTNLFTMPIDGSGAPERLTSSDDFLTPGSWSPDGRVLAFVQRNATTGRDIWMLPSAGDRKPYVFLNSPFDESVPRLSPNGRVLAYVSNASGANDVYMRAMADSTRTRRVTTGGGAEPVWSRDGRELFFRSGDRMMVVTVAAGPEFRTGEPRLLFEGTFAKGTVDTPNYDVTPDGQRFVMIKASDRDTAPNELHVLLDWLVPALTQSSSR